MDEIGSTVGFILSSAIDRLERASKSLMGHEQELARIKEKLNNPSVPGGKKQKLKYRKEVLQGDVIPNLKKRISIMA
jgi:hypothetical protein